MIRIKLGLFLLIIIVLALAACQPKSIPAQPAASPAPPQGGGPGQPKGPVVDGFLTPHGVDGYNWPPNVEVAIQVYDRPQGAVIFTGSSKTGADGHFYAGVDVTTQPGMAVAASYGQDIRSVVLAPLAINAVAPASDTVTGTAAPGAKVNLYAGAAGQGESLQVTASAAGQWTADFSGRFDITPATVVQATVQDASGNGTAFKAEPK